MRLSFNNRNDPQYEEKLNDLLREAFFDFRFWYDLKLWDERYESYALEEDGRIVSNVCVFRLTLLTRGTRCPALSFGAVATRPEYRGRGCSRRLMEHVMTQYEGMPMVLAANETVTEFYPRFGFERVWDRRPVVAREIDNDSSPRKLTPGDPGIYEYLKRRSRYSALFDCAGTETVNMFHLHLGYLSDAIYELPEPGALVVARQDGACLKLFDVVAPRPVTFQELQKTLPFRGVRKIEFGFTPDWLEIPYSMEDYEGEIFFMKNLPFPPGDFKFPELSIT